MEWYSLFYLYTCRTTEAYKLHKFIGQCQLKVKFIDRGHILLASIGLFLMERCALFHKFSVFNN